MQQRLRTSLGWAALAAAWLFGAAAHGQSVDLAIDGEGESAEYREVIEQALEEFKLGNWEEAGALFDQAHRLHPNARTLRAMGITAFESRRYVDALRHLQAALVDTRRPLSEGEKGQLRQFIERAKGFVATLRLAMSPADATVRLDGRETMPDEQGEILVDPGEHEVTVSAPGYEPEARRVRAVSGQRSEIEIRLRSAADGSRATALDEGTGARTRSDVHADAAPPSLRTWAWIGAGASAAALIGAGVALAVRESAISDYNAAACLRGGRTREENCGEHRDSAESAETAGVVLGSIGGALAVTTVLLFVLEPDEAATVAALPCGGGPGILGLACKARF